MYVNSFSVSKAPASKFGGGDGGGGGGHGVGT
jgi:hypothetical protein